MLEDLDHLAVRVRQLAKYAESTKAELARVAQRSQAEQKALSESYWSQLSALTQSSQREKAALEERLAMSEAENRHLRSLLQAARERVEDVLARIPDPDARMSQQEAEH